MRIWLRAPVIFMVIAATAIPVELRPLGHLAVTFNVFSWDFIANIAGYVPVGIVLAGLGPLRALVAAATMSIVAEISQLVMMHRVAQVPDIVSNVIGAIIGLVVCIRWKIPSPALKTSRWISLAAAALAFALILEVRITSGPAPSTRGATSPGILEAHWKLDENRSLVAFDSSGHGLHGRYSKEPMRHTGMAGRAFAFDGATDYVDVGHPSALRLVGSMTITATID